MNRESFRFCFISEWMITEERERERERERTHQSLSSHRQLMRELLILISNSKEKDLGVFFNIYTNNWTELI